MNGPGWAFLFILCGHFMEILIVIIMINNDNMFASILLKIYILYLKNRFVWKKSQKNFFLKFALVFFQL